MAIKRLIYHMGITKTGSSSIQQTLYENNNILEKHGYRYLKEWKKNHSPILKHLFKPYPVRHLGPYNKCKYTNDIEKEAERYFPFKTYSRIKHNITSGKYLKKMLKVMKNTEFETLVISGEYFHHFYLDSTIKKLKIFFSKYFECNDIEIKIIIFVRDPLAWIISSLQQSIFEGTAIRRFDYFETKINTLKGIIKLKEHFPDNLTLIKFEDAVKDKDGLVGCFLKNIDFPEHKLQEINVLRVNESRCMEVMEFAQYVEDIQPHKPYGHNGPRNPNRANEYLKPIKSIKGAKYDFSYHDKLELFTRLKDTFSLLKDNAGFDYSNNQIEPPPPLWQEQEYYSEERIKGFINAFPKLGPAIQKHFLKFFELKYFETLNQKFKNLYFEGSIPRKLYLKSQKKYIKRLFFNIKKMFIKIWTFIKLIRGW